MPRPARRCTTAKWGTTTKDEIWQKSPKSLGITAFNPWHDSVEFLLRSGKQKAAAETASDTRHSSGRAARREDP